MRARHGKSIEEGGSRRRSLRTRGRWTNSAKNLILLVWIIGLGIAGAGLTQTPQTASGWIAKGRQDLTIRTTPKMVEANQAFTTAISLEPNNSEAIVLRTLTSLVVETQNPAFQQLFTAAGVSIKSGDLFDPQYEAPRDEEGLFVPKGGAFTDQVLRYANQRSRLAHALLADLEKISNPRLRIVLTAAETGGNTTIIDYADVQMMRALIHFGKAMLALANSHNVRAEYRLFYDLYKQGRLNMQEITTRLPNLLKFTNPSTRASARTQLLAANDEMQAALPAIPRRRPLSESQAHLFEIADDESAEETADALQLMADALTRTVQIPDESGVAGEWAGQSLNLSAFFSSSTPLRTLLPKRFAETGAFERSSWPDSTLRGILPGAPEKLLDRLAASAWFSVNNEAVFFLEPTIYRAYDFRTIRQLSPEWYSPTSGLAIEANGNVLVAEPYGRLVRRIAPNGSSSIVFGAVQIPGDDGYSWLSGLGVDGSGRIYFSDGWRVFKREVGGAISLLAGSYDYPPRDGTGAAASFSYISSMTVDDTGNVYVVDGNTAVRKISPAGQVTTLSGSAIWSEDNPGYKDGPGREARFGLIYGSIGVDGMGNVYVCDNSNRAIRRITPDGTTSTLVGGPAQTQQHYDGPIGEARLYSPTGLTVDRDGNLFFSDGSTIRQLIPGQSVMTIGGQPQSSGSRDGAGRQARFSDGWNWQPNYLAIGQAGRLKLATQNRVFSAERAPIITTQPASVEAGHGETVTFTVASGAQNPRYQWLRNGQPIRGATQSSLTLTASLATAGIYAVTVSGELGTETSLAASLRIRDRGLLVYNLAGTGFVADSAGRSSRREAAVVVVDRETQTLALIWHRSGPSGKFYRIEYPADTSMHSTGPFTGSVSVLSRVVDMGEHPATEKDVLWFSGTDLLNRLNGKATPPIFAIAPARMAGALQTLSLSDGVLVEVLTANMVLDAAQTLRTRAGQGENLVTAVNRIATGFAVRGYTNIEP